MQPGTYQVVRAAQSTTPSERHFIYNVSREYSYFSPQVLVREVTVRSVESGAGWVMDSGTGIICSVGGRGTVSTRGCRQH